MPPCRRKLVNLTDEQRLQWMGEVRRKEQAHEEQEHRQRVTNQPACTTHLDHHNLESVDARAEAHADGKTAAPHCAAAHIEHDTLVGDEGTCESTFQMGNSSRRREWVGGGGSGSGSGDSGGDSRGSPAEGL